MKIPIAGSHLIDGSWVSSKGSFSAVNPATGESMPPAICEAGEFELNAMAEAAVSAFAATSELPAHWAADFLETIADRLMDVEHVLLERCEAESALPRPRLVGERARTVGQ